MYRDKITLQQALSLEKAGEISIIDTSTDSLPPLPLEGKSWKKHFTHLQAKHRHIPREKLLNFLKAKYLIEFNQGIIDNDTNTYSWRYLYGLETPKSYLHPTHDIEYVYILSNTGYPGLVKIGMTKGRVLKRVDSINTTGVVEEWVARFAIPVSKGCAFMVEQSIHKKLEHCRVTSSHGNSREFFKIDLLTALDELRKEGERYQVGEVEVY